MQELIEKIEGKYPYEFLEEKHLLVNADCLEVMKLMEEESQDIIITDPPYGILNHKIETEFSIELFLKECKRVLKPNSFLGYFGLQPTLTDWNYIANQLFNYKNEVIWYKRAPSNFMLDMMRVYENFMFYTKGKKKFNDVRINFKDFSEGLTEYMSKNIERDINRFSTVLKNYKNFKMWEDFYFKNKKIPNTMPTVVNDSLYKRRYAPNRNISEIQRLMDGGKIRNLVSFLSENKTKIDMTRQGKEEKSNWKHPTVKPVKLIQYIINIASSENQIITDFFAGSFTTTIACIRTNRRSICIELDSGYYEMGVRRVKEELRQSRLF